MNPREACTPNGFRDRRIRPLCHPSARAQTTHETVPFPRSRRGEGDAAQGGRLRPSQDAPTRGSEAEKEGFEPSMEEFTPITP